MLSTYILAPPTYREYIASCYRLNTPHTWATLYLQFAFPSWAPFPIPTYLGSNCTLLSGTHTTYLGYIAHSYQLHIYNTWATMAFATRHTGSIPRLHCTLLSGTHATYLGYNCSLLSGTHATYLSYFAHAFWYTSSIPTFSRGTTLVLTISILLLLIISGWHTNFSLVAD